MSELLAAGPLQLDPIRRMVWRSGVFIALAPREFALLECLVRHAGLPVSRATLLANTWETPPPSTDALSVTVRRLRAQIDDPWHKPLIETIRGTGYRIRT